MRHYNLRIRQGTIVMPPRGVPGRLRERNPIVENRMSLDSICTYLREVHLFSTSSPRSFPRVGKMRKRYNSNRVTCEISAIKQNCKPQKENNYRRQWGAVKGPTFMRPSTNGKVSTLSRYKYGFESRWVYHMLRQPKGRRQMPQEHCSVGSNPILSTSEVVQLQSTAARSSKKTAQGSNRSSNDARQNPLTPLRLKDTYSKYFLVKKICLIHRFSWFKSTQFCVLKLISYGYVVQQRRIPDCHSGGRGSNARRSRHPSWSVRRCRKLVKHGAAAYTNCGRSVPIC